MRPSNQNNKRMRGRGRKGPNPLTRTYESNGPDVKIRGTAMHVAEKYQQLARDAQASGDRIMSENYNQHAEHYQRIVAAAQPTPQPQQNNQPSARAESDDNQVQATASGTAPVNGSEQISPERTEPGAPVMESDSPQPFIEDMPVINQEGQVNGAGQKAGADGDEGEDKPRRRGRTPRPRAPRRAPVAASSEDVVADSAQETPEVAATSVEDDVPPKPRRRVARPRRTKPAEDAPAETPAASE
ncbi:MAG: DUF4167 domain-containing protein [Roseibium sp.]